jgi:hypothetical protein
MRIKMMKGTKRRKRKSRRDDRSCGGEAHKDYFWTFKCIYHPRC